MHIRAFLSDSMQPSAPHVFSSVLADLAWCLCIRFQAQGRKEPAAH